MRQKCLNFRSIEPFVSSIFEFHNFRFIEFKKCRNSYFGINLVEYWRSIQSILDT